jgi:hypothetical protein
MLQEWTDEQQQIRRAVEAGQDLQVVAHAGTGKTSTLLGSLAALSRKTLFLEYNRELKEHAQRAARRLGIDSYVWVTNYDGLLTGAYAADAPHRGFCSCMHEVCSRNTVPSMSLNFSLVVLDEAQDMTPLLAWFVHKVLLDVESALGSRPQLVMTGDPKQTIYGYRGASPAFLMCRHAPFSAFDRRVLFLTQSHRLPEVVCRVVESVCAGHFTAEAWAGRLHGQRRTDGSVSVRTAASAGARVFTDEDVSRVFSFLGSECEPAGVCLLGYSMREGAELFRRLAAELAALKVPLRDENKGGAVQLCTIHRSKGCEWQVVVLAIDSDWTTSVSGRTVLRPHFAALLYVAMTRTKRHLIVVQESSSRALARIWGRPTESSGDDCPVLRAWRSAQAGPDEPPPSLTGRAQRPSGPRSLLGLLRASERPAVQDAVASLFAAQDVVQHSGARSTVSARVLKAVAMRLLCERRHAAFQPEPVRARQFWAQHGRDGAPPAKKSRLSASWPSCTCSAEHWCRHFACDWHMWDAVADLLDPGAFYGTLVHVPLSRAELASMAQLEGTVAAVLPAGQADTLKGVAESSIGRSLCDALLAWGGRDLEWSTDFLPGGGSVLALATAADSIARVLVLDWCKAASDDGAEETPTAAAAVRSPSLLAFVALVGQQAGCVGVELLELPAGRRTLFRPVLLSAPHLRSLLRAFGR